MSDEENKPIIRFDPPAYIQRYGKVVDIMNDERWKGKIQKAVDFGCSECAFFLYLRDVKGLTSILEVDVDEDVLIDKYLNRIDPSFRHHVNQRNEPLTVSVFRGSVCEPDYRLIGCDAVVCIELIEHLYPGPLERLPHNIFGFIEPHLAFITTPNADFNVNFPSLKNGGFRHPDHKFEWTREQFHDWGNNIISRYPKYTVEFHDIAYGPKETVSTGACSQMAVFIHKNYNKKTEIDENEVTLFSVDARVKNGDANSHKWDNMNWNNYGKICEFYKLVKKVEYPFWIDTRTDEEKALAHALYILEVFLTYENDFYDVENNCWRIPLWNLTKHDGDVNVLRNALKSTDYEVENDKFVYRIKYSDSEEEEDHIECNSSEHDVPVTRVTNDTDDPWAECCVDSEEYWQI